ncbi:CHASE2 domain-containing protein [Rhodovastum atsumiense]|uniref:CHASE2 domain-containing protein n=1 Tax=Rhodovastum atsumiense TaxID=504468 RepID=UPI0020243291|nr:CHASE2 domain-containing protein [Rhodovastum atsumiense]
MSDASAAALRGGIPAPASIRASDRNGFSDLVLDRGGVARRGLLYLSGKDGWGEAFSLKLALLYLADAGLEPAADAQGFLRLGRVSLGPLDGTVGGYARLDTRGYQILREFRPATRLRAFPLRDLLEGKVLAAALRGRIAVLGTAADSVKDPVATPMNAVSEHLLPGVTLHGLFAAQLVAHGLEGLVPTRPLPRPVESPLIGLLVLLGAVAGVGVRQLWLLAVVSAGGTVLLFVTVHAAFLAGL